MAVPASTRFESPAGPLELLRHPRRDRELLQAWCSADKLLIEAGLDQPASSELTLVANDEHGALTTAMTPAALWTDSATAATAAAANLAHNGRGPVEVRWSTDPPGAGLQLVLMRVPKQMAYFEYQLAILSGALADGGLLVCGGMDKHLSPQTAGVIEKYFGPVNRHPGRHKARLFSARKSGGGSVAPPGPSAYFCEALGATLTARANVFSADSLDIGSRFLIEHMHRIEPGDALADLACGNGVLGFCALQAGLGNKLTLCDESAMAIASARDNASALGYAGVTQLHHGDGFIGLEQSFDRILCNPPFHLGHTVDEFAGRRLLSQCARRLSPGGELHVVANRHLEYGHALKHHFRSVARLAQDKKFIIWTARGG